jgi:serine/threonine protein kinase
VRATVSLVFIDGPILKNRSICHPPNLLCCILVRVLGCSSQTITGTPPFMAPEMWEGGAPYTSAADLWSFGCLMYELAALRPPFCAAK